ncbi:MAG: hypothetical protein Q8Q49_04755 [bacterium]|nr:hypothetical protein [bacterium]
MCNHEGENGRIKGRDLLAVPVPDLALSLLVQTEKRKGHIQTGVDPLDGLEIPLVELGKGLLSTMKPEVADEEFDQAAKHISDAFELVKGDLTPPENTAPLVPVEDPRPVESRIVGVVFDYVSALANRRQPITPTTDLKPWTPPPAVEIKYSPIANNGKIHDRPGF